MISMNEAISMAIKVQATREGKDLTEVAKSINIGRTAFWERLNNRRAWNTDQLAILASALNLKDAWELVALANDEMARATKLAA